MEKNTGLVLKSMKYGDTSLILHVYSRESGMVSLLIKGFYSPKKKNMRPVNFPFTLIEFNLNKASKSELKVTQQLQLIQENMFIAVHPVKSMILQFLAELLHAVLKEDEPNPELFDFIKQQLNLYLAKEKNYAEFHLIFLIELTRFIGFYPNIREISMPYFDLYEGRFTDQKSVEHLNSDETQIWKKLLQASFDGASKNIFQLSEREFLLDTLLTYFQMHSPGFKIPRSIEIIKEIVK